MNIRHFALFLLTVLFTADLVSADPGNKSVPLPENAPDSMSDATDVEVDRIASELDDARIEYELKMQNLRKKVLASLGNKIESARRRSDDLDKIHALELQGDTFRKTGEWPKIHRIQKLRKNNEGRRIKLDRAYENARKAYLKPVSEGQELRDKLAERIVEEFEALQEEDDVVPWGENEIRDLNDLEREIEKSEKAFTVNTLGEHKYRIQVEATRLSGAGPLVIELPVPGNKTTKVSTTPNAEGKVRVLLSVREGLVSADLGPPRPIAAPKDGGQSGKITFASANSSYRVDSVQVKPIFGRRHLKKNQNNKKPQVRRQAQPRVDPAALLTKKSEWVGNQLENGISKPITIKILQKSAGFFKTRILKPGGSGGLDLYIAVKDGNLALTGITPVGNGNMKITGFRGGGAVNGATIIFDYTYEWKHPAKMQRRGTIVTGGFTVTRSE